MKSIPKTNTESKPIPEYLEKNIPSPTYTENSVPMPEHIDKTIQLPPVGDERNTVLFGKKRIEIKPTKLKYQRDHTAEFYRALKQMPLVDILSLPDGMLDPERSSDKMLFDWLIAVTDNPKLVAAYYDELDTDTINKLLEIFCRLNHIKDDEKKQEPQMTG